MKVVNDGTGEYLCFFLDAPGGTGKTFLISLILGNYIFLADPTDVVLS